MAKPPADPRAAIYAAIYAVIARIPRRRVVTYGQVALYAGLPGRARLVGRALAELAEGSRLPWYRVINARGEVSPRGGLGLEEGYQRHLLEEEGFPFDARGRIDLDRFGWEPVAPPRRAPRRATAANQKPPRKR